MTESLAPITWTNDRIPIASIEPWLRNPRYIEHDHATRLGGSYDEFGEVEPIIVGPADSVTGLHPLYNGHQRVSVLLQLHGPGFSVDVRISSRLLTEKEREKLTIYLHQGTNGKFNFDTLANEFELPELLDWGFTAKLLGLDPDDESLTPIGKPEQKISPELHERQDYLVFYVENSFDWNYLLDFFDVEIMETAPVGHKTIKQRGTGRVIPATKLIEALREHSHESA